MSLYHPHFHDNIESWQVFSDDEIICAFLQNETLKKKEMISFKDDKFTKRLTPLDCSFSSSDVSDQKKNSEEE
jgi:hypothetical protein